MKITPVCLPRQCGSRVCLPARTAGYSFERADHIPRDPAAVEPSGLGLNTLIIDIAFESAWKEREASLKFREVFVGRFVRPRRIFHNFIPDAYRPIGRGTLPLAEEFRFVAVRNCMFTSLRGCTSSEGGWSQEFGKPVKTQRLFVPRRLPERFGKKALDVEVLDSPRQTLVRQLAFGVACDFDAGLKRQDALRRAAYSVTSGTEMTKYAVVIARTRTGYSAHVPDLPGCIAAGKTLEATRRLIHDGIEFHLEAMRADGDEIPEPSLVDFVKGG